MSTTIERYKYSEIFYSFQGEGHYIGKPTAWIRFFLCNLQCDGFGQKDPKDPASYVLPYKTVDLSNITKIEDLPVFEYGCDSSYTWAKKYRHLAQNKPGLEIAQQIIETIKHTTNPEGLFCHPVTRQETHMAFTGGEPLLNQAGMMAIMNAFSELSNMPHKVTVETNGTQPLSPEMFDMIKAFQRIECSPKSREKPEWFWSCSPKLFSTSGESAKKAIKPACVANYVKASKHGQLKYVVDGSAECWLEVEKNIELYRAAGVDWPVYIMPVGATKEQQETQRVADIAIEAMHRGYYFSGRLHCYVFGNKIGT